MRRPGFLRLTAVLLIPCLLAGDVRAALAIFSAPAAHPLPVVQALSAPLTSARFSPRLKGHLAAATAITSMAFALSHYSQMAVTQPAFPLAFDRNLLITGVLGAMSGLSLFFHRAFPPSRLAVPLPGRSTMRSLPTWLVVIIYAVIFQGISTPLLVLAYQGMSPNIATVINNTTPPVVFLMGLFWFSQQTGALQERSTPGRWRAFAVGVMAVASSILLLGGNGEAHFSMGALGIAIASMLTWAFAQTTMKILSRQLDGLQLSFLTFGISLAPLAVFKGVGQPDAPWFLFDRVGFLPLLMVAVFQGISNFFMLRASRLLNDAAQQAIWFSLTPVIIILFRAVLGFEPFQASHFIPAGLSIFSLWLFIADKKKETTTVPIDYSPRYFYAEREPRISKAHLTLMSQTLAAPVISMRSGERGPDAWQKVLALAPAAHPEPVLRETAAGSILQTLGIDDLNNPGGRAIGVRQLASGVTVIRFGVPFMTRELSTAPGLRLLAQELCPISMLFDLLRDRKGYPIAIIPVISKDLRAEWLTNGRGRSARGYSFYREIIDPRYLNLSPYLVEPLQLGIRQLRDQWDWLTEHVLSAEIHIQNYLADEDLVPHVRELESDRPPYVLAEFNRRTGALSLSQHPDDVSDRLPGRLLEPDPDHDRILYPRFPTTYTPTHHWRTDAAY